MENTAVKRQLDRTGDGAEEQLAGKRLRMDLKKPVRLMDLPLGPLHLIFSKLPLDSQKLLRNASQEMRDEHNDFLLHNYKSFTHKLRNLEADNRNSVELKIIKVVEEASNYIAVSGYVFSFMDNLSFYFQDREDIEVTNMQHLLHRSYHELEYSRSENFIGMPCRTLLHRRRLVYMVTLLNLLRQFSTFRKVNSCMELMHWKLHLQLRGIHISANHETAFGITDGDKLVDLMIIICELLVYDMSDIDTGFCRYLDVGRSVYNYGIKRQRGSRGPRLDLHFKILAPLAMRNLLEDALDGKQTAIECPELDKFSIQLNLHNSGLNWILKKNWKICIVPLS